MLVLILNCLKMSCNKAAQPWWHDKVTHKNVLIATHVIATATIMTVMLIWFNLVAVQQRFVNSATGNSCYCGPTATAAALELFFLDVYTVSPGN